MERSEEVRISLDRLFSRDTVTVKPEWLTYPQLRAEQDRLAALPPPTPDKAREQARDEMKLKLIVQEKFNLSLAVFSFALIGVPLGIKVSRRETSANLGLALLLVLGYYLITVIVKWLDQRPEYRPDLLFWLPNVIFLALAVRLFRRMDR